jgi:hypothetical protein
LTTPFVTVLDASPAAASGAAATAPPVPPRYGRALWDFAPTATGDLELKKGDRPRLLRKIDDWWEGELNGRVGIFPSTYIEVEK